MRQMFSSASFASANPEMPQNILVHLQDIFFVIDLKGSGMVDYVRHSVLVPFIGDYPYMPVKNDYIAALPFFDVSYIDSQ